MRRKLSFERLEQRNLMSWSAWIGGSSANWNTPANWANGVPTSTSDVYISPQTPETITIPPGSSLSVNSLTLGSNATLALPAADPTNPSSNGLSNATFESPVATNSTTAPGGAWFNWGSAYLSTQYAYAGSESLVVSGQNSGAGQNVAATPGVSYTASVYAMTPSSNQLSGSMNAELNLLFFNGNTLLSNYTAPNQDVILTGASAAGGTLTGSVGSSGWNHFYTTAVAPAGTNRVSIQLSVWATSSTYGGAVYFDNAAVGPSQLAAPTLVSGNISNAGTIQVGTGAAITANGNLSNTGMLQIGAAASVSVTGSFTQTSSGILDLQLGSASQAGSLAVTYAANVAGLFEIDLVNGYLPAKTDSFTPLTYGYATSGFTSYQLPGASTYQLYAAQSFTNVLVSAAPTAPVSTTIYAGVDELPVSSNLNGVNVTYYDSSLQTAQSQQLITGAGLSLLRFPGGSSSDEYHFNLAANVGDASAVNIPQFAEDVANDNANGMATVDYGSGSPQEAAAELAYLVGSPSDTTPIGTGIEWLYGASAWTNVNWGTVGYWASLRAASPLPVDDGLNFMRINHAAPFSTIKYWEIGNEDYGYWETDHHGVAGPGGVSTGAAHDPATYDLFCKTFQSLAAEITAKAGLPAILIGVDTYDPTGQSDNNWTKNMLTIGLADGFVPSYLSDHMYIQAPGQESDSYLLNDTVTDPASYFDWSTKYSLYESLLQQTLGTQASGVQLMATEFGSVYGSPGKQSTSLVQGLYVAESVGSLMESGYTASAIWNLHDGWQLGNNDSNALYGWRQGGDFGVLGSTSQTTAPATGAFIGYPSYYALQLVSKIALAGGQTVAFGNNYADLNVYPVMEANGNLEMMVVNTNPAAPITDQISLNGFSPVKSVLSWQYGKAEDAAQAQSATGASALTFTSITGGLNGSTFTYTFPSYSMTVLIFEKTPAVVVAATASPSPATIGTTTSLSVLGGDINGENALTYIWSIVGTPPASVAFSANGTNAAKNTSVLFTTPGTYTFLVTISDGQGSSVTSTVTVTVTTTVTSGVNSKVA